MPAPPCMDAAVPDDTAYDQLQLLCLRESGAATELLKGTRALNLRTPELSALAADMLEAQRVFVCALGRWTEHTAGPAARRLACSPAPPGARRAARRGRDLPFGAAATGLGGRRRRGDAAGRGGRARRGARAGVRHRRRAARRCRRRPRGACAGGAGSADPECGAVPLCAAPSTRAEATRAVAPVLDSLCSEHEGRSVITRVGHFISTAETSEPRCRPSRDDPTARLDDLAC